MSEELSALLSAWKMDRSGAAKIVAAMERSLACGLPSGLWHECLRLTGTTSFLRCLGSQELRTRWAEACFGAIGISGYSLRDMFEQRAADFPDKILFQDSAGGSRWTYRSSSRQMREIAASFLLADPEVEPRVALLTDNCVEGAFCDLACLCFDIVDTPLNTHFDPATIATIVDRLGINIVVTDTEERRELLRQIAGRCRSHFRIVVLDAEIADERNGICHLGETRKRLSEAEISSALNGRRCLAVDQVATVMFTSGSAGETKGISFSQYNLVTKRFARAAALPEVGEEEVLLSYLPFFHTFGRYLEMLGTIYWGGTYVFSANPSFETMLALLPKVNPTGLVSIPLRWAQLKEHCLGLSGGGSSSLDFRKTVGNRLRWGLSAAGYLDPRTFRFFIQNGVDLCSGFGVTEATGGIMMTPHGKYVDNTLGIPLPGIATRLGDRGELQIGGHYVGRPLEEKGPGDTIPIPRGQEPENWSGTGDLFRVLPNGYYEIVDRIKDIYKNDRGQTISPRKVENAFNSVPGIRRTFLAGDAHPYNILLIVPDEQDPGLKEYGSPARRRDFFRGALAAANREFPPYERIVDFAVLERDFSPGNGEISPDGTLNRKAIEASFSALLEPYFRSGTVEFAAGSVTIRIPRWFFRDSGILEDEIGAIPDGLINRTSGLELRVGQKPGGHWLIGDLEYAIAGRTIDLGLFARQPRLWLGNPSLVAFCPCKNGWDVPLGGVSPEVLRPASAKTGRKPSDFPRLTHIREARLASVHHLLCTALFGESGAAEEAIEAIGRMLPESDLRWNDVMRSRLEALAQHLSERVRCLAYQVLLLDDPTPEYSKALSAFIESGLPFLNRESIEAIASSRFEKFQLESFRRRLAGYRERLQWPADEARKSRFRDIFELLINFVEVHPDFYSSVRAELAVWSLFEEDREVAESARTYLTELRRRFDAYAAQSGPASTMRVWRRRLVFDEEIQQSERRVLLRLLAGTHFLKQSVMLAFDENGFSIDDVPERGIWISRLPSSNMKTRSYRASVNLRNGKHFDLEVVLGEDTRERANLETLYWSLALAGHPSGPRVLSQRGCFHPELRARASAYPGQLTVWEKIREYADLHGPGAPMLKPHAWRKLFVQGIAVFFRAWQSSRGRIVPGTVSPANSLVAELDFQYGGLLASLAGWRRYEGPISLVRPMIANFYQKTVAHYPWCRDQLHIHWIFDAALEGLGDEKGRAFLSELLETLLAEPLEGIDGSPVSDALRSYISIPGSYLPLHLFNAIDRYEEWEMLNGDATAPAREQTVEELYRLYQLFRYPEYVRYYLCRHTYFRHLPENAAAAFDRLLRRMRGERDSSPLQLIELSELQDALVAEQDRGVFSRMVFQRSEMRRGEAAAAADAVVARITDRYGEAYTFRETTEPREIGQLHRFFFNQNIPREITGHDRYYVVIDSSDRVVGGICYQIHERVVQLDGIVVAAPLQGRGIGSAMEQEFCARISRQRGEVIRAHFLRRFHLSRGYRIDKRWGTLVKFLN